MGDVTISRGELLWITLGVWIGGVSILTLMPLLLIPQMGILPGMAGAYVVFFVAWQPVQGISQRVLGVKAAVLRMVGFVGGAAVVAFYLREWLLTIVRG